MAITLKKDAFVKNLIKHYKLAGHIDKAIGAGEFEWQAKFEPKKGDDAWHPSGDCVPSPHALYNRAQSALEEIIAPLPSANMMKTYTVGHFWHHYIQYIVVEKLGFASWGDIERRGTRVFTGADESENDTPKPYHWATGMADIAPCKIPSKGPYLVDIKTMGSHDFKQQSLPNWCAPKYECQVNIYMDWFDLERTIILCVSKDSPHEFKEFEFRRNQPLIDAIYNKWTLVADCIDQQIEPDPDFDISLPLSGPKL